MDIINYIFKGILFFKVFNIPPDYGSFHSELGDLYIFYSYFIAYAFVIVALLFREKLYDKLQFIFSKKFLAAIVLIYLIAVANAFFKSYEIIRTLQKDITLKESTITYEYVTILASLTPRVVMKNNDSLFYYTVEKKKLITLLQYVLLVLVHLLMIHFLITRRLFFRKKMPFIDFYTIKSKNSVLVLWFVLFAVVNTTIFVLNKDYVSPIAKVINLLWYNLRNI